MGTLKTTINLNSTNSLPTPINETAINNIVTGNFVESGKKTISSWGINFMENNEGLLTTRDCGPNGAYIYVKSLSTNINKVKIYGEQQLNEENVESFTTLNPGDSILLPLTPQQNKIFATTNFGEATIDYYIVDRGGELGQSALFLNTNDTNHKYVILDSQLAERLPYGSPTPYWDGRDLGLTVADWGYNDPNIVNNKGYILNFYNYSNSSHQIKKFINNRGEVVGTWEITGSYDSWDMDNNGYLLVNNDGTTHVTYFDGDNVYEHEIISSGFDFPWDWHPNTSDGAFVLEVYDYLGITNDTANLLINKDKLYVLEVLNTSGDLEVYDAPTYMFGNFVFLTIYNNDISKYDKFKIFNSKGVLLKEYTLTDHYDINYLDYNFYGTNKLLFIFTDNSDIDYILTYDGTNNFLSGIDSETNLLNETHEWSGNYNYRWYYAYDKYQSIPYFANISDSNFDKESIVIIYSDYFNNHGTRHINSEVNFCDILYKFGNQTKFTTYKFADNETKFIRIPFPWDDYNIYPSTNLFAISYGVSGYKTGPMNVMAFTPTSVGEFQLAAEMDKAIGGISSWSNSVQVQPVGEYLMYSSRIEYLTTNTTTYVMFKSATIKDSLTSSGDSRENYYIRYNSLLTYGDITEKVWYFNTVNNKFTEITNGWLLFDQGYNNKYNFETYITGMNDGNILLYPDNFNVAKPVAKLIKRGVLSNDLILSQTDGSHSMDLGSDVIILNYEDMNNDYKNVAKLYDLNLNLVRTQPLLTNDIYYGDVIGKRIYLRTYNADPKGVPYLYSYYMISTNGVAYLANTQSMNYVYNDSFWYDWIS